ncbi:MAG: enoyl-CoA hydratase-related protein [Rhodovibrionaceae bacterium]
MSDSPLKTERRAGVLEITLDRPKANAIDAATSREMSRIFAEFRDDPSLRVAILTGAGEKFFSAGWDLSAAAEGEAVESDYGEGGFGGFPELPGLDKPVIAAVNGYAVGGGFEIAMAADMIVAATHAQFWLPEAQLGILPDAGTLRLPRLLPRALAIEMLLTGRRMDAVEAHDRGLVNLLAEPGTVLEQARGLAEQIAGAAPLSVAAILDIERRTASLPLQEAYALLRSGKIESYKTLLESEDALEGPRAFAEKRTPVWKGR